MSSWRWPFFGGRFFWGHLEISHSMRGYSFYQGALSLCGNKLGCSSTGGAAAAPVVGVDKSPWQKWMLGAVFNGLKLLPIKTPPELKVFWDMKNAWVFDMNHPHSKKKTIRKVMMKQLPSSKGWRMNHLSASCFFCFENGPWIPIVWWPLGLHMNFNPGKCRSYSRKPSGGHSFWWSIAFWRLLNWSPSWALICASLHDFHLVFSN